MPNKNNTAGFSKRLGKLIKSIRQKAVNNENLIKALNKVLHFNKSELFEFLGIKEFVSTLFQKTKTLIVPKNPDSFTISEETVMTFLKPVLEREAKLKNIIPSIDNDIWRWFLGKIVPGFLKRFVVVIYRFLKNITHQQILDEAERMKIKKIYTWLEALSIIRTSILAGEVDKNGTGIIVYFNFKVDDKEILCRFRAYRRGDGQLRLRVSGVRLDDAWDADSGACFSN